MSHSYRGTKHWWICQTSISVPVDTIWCPGGFCKQLCNQGFYLVDSQTPCHLSLLHTRGSLFFATLERMQRTSEYVWCERDRNRKSPLRPGAVSADCASQRRLIRCIKPHQRSIRSAVTVKNCPLPPPQLQQDHL